MENIESIKPLSFVSVAKGEEIKSRENNEEVMELLRASGAIGEPATIGDVLAWLKDNPIDEDEIIVAPGSEEKVFAHKNWMLVRKKDGEILSNRSHPFYLGWNDNKKVKFAFVK